MRLRRGLLRIPPEVIYRANHHLDTPPPLISTSTDSKNNNPNADENSNPNEVTNIVDTDTKNNNDDGVTNRKQKRQSEKHKTYTKKKNKKKKPCKPEVEKIVRTGSPHDQKGELLNMLIKLKTDLSLACVLEKKLVSTDINVDQCRLQLNAAQIAPLFDKAVLTAQENAAIYRDPGLQVKAYDFKGNEYVMELKFLGTTGFYRIKKGWGKFLETHSVKKDQIMVVWVLRINAQPGMILLNYDEEDEQRKIDAALLYEQAVAEGMMSFVTRV